LKAWRIAHRAFPIMDGAGAASFPGRWNAAGQPAIYCGGSFAITMLERLCYAALGRTPTTDVYVEIDIPDHVVERFDPRAHRGWHRPQSTVAKAFGRNWLAQRRSAALIVPSAVTRLDFNVVLNPEHPDFSMISWTRTRPVDWDMRLFAR
jgi:RES domain-containing protein